MIPSTNPHGRRSRLALAALCIAAVVALATQAAACGGSTGPTAKSLVPKLTDLGLEIAEEGRDPFAAPSQDTYRARYASTDGSARAAVVVLFVEDDTTAAEGTYAQLAKALENPPAEFFGADAEQAETDPLPLGEERRAFLTAQPDSQGNQVWTDIYRKGRVIAITQLLSAADAGHIALRQAIAEAILERVK